MFFRFLNTCVKQPLPFTFTTIHGYESICFALLCFYSCKQLWRRGEEPALHRCSGGWKTKHPPPQNTTGQQDALGQLFAGARYIVELLQGHTQKFQVHMVRKFPTWLGNFVSEVTGNLLWLLSVLFTNTQWGYSNQTESANLWTASQPNPEQNGNCDILLWPRLLPGSSWGKGEMGNSSVIKS